MLIKDLRRIERLSEEMKNLLVRMARDTICISSKAPDGMPYCNTGTTGNPTASYAMRLYEQHDRFVFLYRKIAEIINTEPDLKMRSILVYRYVELLSWNKVARQMNSSSSAVRKFFYRHITNP